MWALVVIWKHCHLQQTMQCQSSAHLQNLQQHKTSGLVTGEDEYCLGNTVKKHTSFLLHCIQFRTFSLHFGESLVAIPKLSHVCPAITKAISSRLVGVALSLPGLSKIKYTSKLQRNEVSSASSSKKWHNHKYVVCSQRTSIN